MALSDIVSRLLDTLMDGTGARVRFIGEPQTQPQNYPAVYAMWERTEPTSNTYGQRTSGTRTKKGVQRLHTFKVFVLAGIVLDGVAVDEATHETADAVMNAIEGDDTLRGVMSSDATQRASVVDARPYMGEFGFGVQAEISVLEL